MSSSYSQVHDQDRDIEFDESNNNLYNLPELLINFPDPPSNLDLNLNSGILEDMTESLSISANLDENSLYNSNRFANDRSIESFSISREASDLSLNQMSGSIVSLNSSTVQ